MIAMRAPRQGDIDVNAWPAIIAAVVLGTVGVLSFIIQPGLVQGFVTNLKFDEAHAVNLAGVEMLGVAVATVVLATWNHRLDWHLVVAAGLITAAVGDIGSAWMLHSPLFAGMRGLAGLGEGALISISFTFVGITEKTERNVALYLVLLLTYGAFGLWLLPDILNNYGFTAVFYGFAGISIVSLVAIPFVPHAFSAVSVDNPEARPLPMVLLIIALGAVLAYNLAQGMAWSVLELVGIGAGLSEQPVANALFLSQILAVGGALGSVFLAHRINRNGAIAFGILAGAASICLLLGRPSLLLFTVAVCGFNVLWNFVLPFILGRICDFETSGRMMSFAIAMQMIGLGLGPLLNGQLLSSGYRTAELVCIALFLISYALLWLPMRRHHQLLGARA